MAVDRIEGHLKWIHELEPVVLKNRKDEFESLESYCAKLLKIKINDDAVLAHDDEEHLNEGQDCQEDDDKKMALGGRVKARIKVRWTERATIFTRKLHALAFSVLVGNTENAKLIVREIDQLVGDIIQVNDLADIQCQVMLYCVDVLRWQCGGGVDNELAEKLNRKWEEIVRSNEGMATVCFLKGMCGSTLKVDEKVVVDFYLKAMELDPECLVWYHHAYRSLRRTRGKDGPSDQEVEIAKKAYQLCNAEDMVSVLYYGVTLKDILWTDRLNERFWRNKEKVYRECLEAFEKAVELATGHWRVKVKLYLAEFLCFGAAPEEDKVRGRDMLLELKNDYPDNVPVLLKLGNLYRDNGIVQKASDCYKQALDGDPTLVSCIMEYLQLLKENRRKNAYLRNKAKAEIVRVLDKALSPEYVLKKKHTEKLRKEQRKLESW